MQDNGGHMHPFFSSICQNKKATGLLFCIIGIGIFVPYLIFLSQKGVNYNIAWLTSCAGKIMNGARMSDVCFDSNPPLSVLIYTLPALLIKSGLFNDKALIMDGYTLFCALLSTAAVWRIFRVSAVMNITEQNLVLIAYLLANIILTGDGFGERDHFVVMGLFPLALVQYSLTYGYALPARTKWAVLIFGAIGLCIKPHYGLISAALLLHRMTHQKRIWSIIKDIDFIVLSLVTLLYIGTVFLFFPDFIRIILPVSFSLYVLQDAQPFMLRFLLTFFLAVAGLRLCFVWRKDISPLCGFFLLLASLCLIPYLVQHKGWAYHLIPYNIFAFCGGALLLQHWIKREALKLFNSKNEKKTALCTVIILIFFTYFMGISPTQTPSAKTYLNFPVIAEINRYRANNPSCRFFMFDIMEEVQITNFYAACSSASRFPSYWFMGGLYNEEKNIRNNAPHHLSADQLAFYKQELAEFTAEDFKRYRPDIVLIAHIHTQKDEEETFDFPAYFSSANAGFAKEWQNYRFVKTMNVTRPRFANMPPPPFPLYTATYDIYERNTSENIK